MKRTATEAEKKAVLDAVFTPLESEPPVRVQRSVRLLLKSRTSKRLAVKVSAAINSLYPPARLSGRSGKLQIRFQVPEEDTKHVWLLLLLKCAKDLKRAKQPNDQAHPTAAECEVERKGTEQI